jgi:regulator of protease activity HflC (stomatin/prohibitin superfamily)
MPANVGALLGSALFVILVVAGLVVFFASLRMCSEWERKVVLRLGRYTGVRGPGIFLLLPFIETTPFTIDMRVNTDNLVAEQSLTKDGASVTVDTIIYWQVVDAGRAAIRVQNFRQAVMGAAQGGLRDTIGRNDLGTLLSQRRELDQYLTQILDEQTEPWGIKVVSVQLRDIRVPDNLQDALSRMAQAERERQARVILGESEVAVAQMFSEAGEIYRSHPTALHLRGMNMLYETMRSGVSTVIVVPSSALETMNLGSITGLTVHAPPPTQPTPPAPPTPGTQPPRVPSPMAPQPTIAGPQPTVAGPIGGPIGGPIAGNGPPAAGQR